MRPSLAVLSPQLIQRIFDEARHILATVGMEIRGPHLKQRLVEDGLPLDASGERVLFPADVIDRALASTPSSFTLYTRDGQPHAMLGGDAVHFTPASSGLRIHDHRSGEVRAPLTSDFVEYIRLVDGLPHIAYPATAFSTNDIEAGVSDAWRLYLCLTHSRKPVVSGAFTEHGVPRMAEMMALFRRDRADLIARPMAIFTITATGNFRYSEDSCQNLLDCAEWGIPMEIVPVTLMGLIAPVTLVGAAVFHTVDVLAGIVMAQLVRPGTPVLFGGAPAAFHMREATSPMLAIEALHLDLMYNAIGKHLRLPTQSYMALSDSKFLDAQAGAETFGSAILAALAGVNSVSGPGMLDYVMTFSLPKLLFDNELCGQALRLIRPVEPVDDLPTLDLVHTQLVEQHMLTAGHTLTHWPQQLYLPGPVYDRTNRESWERAGSKKLIQRAIEEVEERLAAYQPLESDSAIDAELRRLIQNGIVSGQPLPGVPALDHPATPTPDARTARRQERRARRNRRGNHQAD
jgi:trimethylamine--corrinoid protein Co-methyltransferase